LLFVQLTFDAPKRLEDGEIPLVESIESLVDLVEVTENLLTELCVRSVQPIEATVDGHESLVDGRKLPAEELDELLVLTGTHAALLPDDGRFAQLSLSVDGSYANLVV
jgi:hypothetical protein